MASPVPSYDEVFFSSKPAPDRHIDRFSLLAQLCGVQPATPKNPRVLELGCSTGTNLISMSLTVPHATFVGIDNSHGQIALASQCANELELQNVRFECLDLKQLTSSFGNFDYIICHGLYSWVSSDVRAAILRVCRECLSEQGIAFISFNAQPGWNLRESIGAWLRACPQPQPADQAIETARSRLELLKLVQEDDYSPSGIVARDAINHLLDQSPALFQHEILNGFASSVSLIDFVRLAQESGLRYLADSGINHLLFFSPEQLGLSSEAHLYFKELGQDVALKEQLWDLLYPRGLRKVLLCRSEVTIHKPRCTIQPDWYVAAPVTMPLVNASLSDHSLVTFETARGAALELTEPLVKAALQVLSSHWPLPISMHELARLTDQKLLGSSDSKASEVVAHTEKLAEALFPYFVQGHLEVTLTPPQFCLEPREKPQAHPLARYQSNSQEWVCNYRHEYVILNNVERSILRLLDGTRSLSDLKRDTHALYDSGEILITASEEEVEQLGGISSLLDQLLTHTLLNFYQSALIC